MVQSRLRAALVLIPTALVLLSSSASGLLVDLAGHWSAPLISALEAKGVISGDALGRFEPEAPLTRAQMAKMIVASLGHDADAKLLANYDGRYTDIPSWHWAKGYVEALAELAVTDGYGDGRFGPADTVSRAQMAVFLVRAIGLAEQARLLAYEPTGFVDDAVIPAWARGHVQMARSLGLMTGFADGSFRPQQSITRAEGASALLRLEEFMGTAYHLAGTLTAFDPASGRGIVRDSLGTERAFMMSPAAQYFHNGVGVAANRISRFDQVWVVQNAQGQGIFLEARYRDLLGMNPTVNGQALQLSVSGQVLRSFKVQQGALSFLNGRPVPLSQITGAQDVYLALDMVTDEVRVVDAVKTTINGTFTGAVHDQNQMLVVQDGKVTILGLHPSAILLRNGERVALSDFKEGDPVRLALDEAGLVTYVQAER